MDERYHVMIGQLDEEYIRTRPTKVYNRLLSYALFEGRPLTTPGQWINPLVFANYGLLSKIPCPKKVEKPIFVLGTGRSGSTILGKIFSIHKSVGFLNEPKAFWHYLYPNEDLIGSYTREPANYFLDESIVDQKMIDKAHRIYGWYLLLSGANRVVDKYPELIFREDYVRKIFPDAKFIFLVRNGWDTCASVDNWSETKGKKVGNEIHDWWGADRRKWNLLVDQVLSKDEVLKNRKDEIRAFTEQKDMSAVEWILTMKQGMNLKEDSYLLKYEDLVDNREQTLQKILDFCELPKDSKQLDYLNMVLKKNKPKEPIVLHEAIADEFDAIQKTLKYT